ncbi:D-alanyl-D-alanine carboxypeptidase/D-alanyl-D-alanine-endopeptidase [Mucilaginibacter flavidus]|uniref:D-alanyl-D-alanine carboxypeptidase/D-alanyl-D-alanine-endopeptidase n=1 Tax=Mucilaginibacter flavidus TaxID=2949309 RepID=UPI002093477C|nr:D-alanyl-D-alanine carboxypeptidase [Mucilaginibacter flavidus]MCO5950403.1 D-alanyl-D-alanine carboxypeptidase [Mucilaginibacter flavidus]
MQRNVFKIITLGFCLLMCFGYSCADKIRKRPIKRQFAHTPGTSGHFTGFALYDLDNKKMVYELNSDKYFNPASNTKLFTFYTCLKMLGDSVPALKYITKGDSLIFWGTGDPSFLHSDLKGINGFNLLKNSGKKLFFSPGNYTGQFFGPGWAWDDYNDYYQAEINELPVEDNVALIYADKNDSLQIKPAYLKKYLKCDTLYRPATYRVKRDLLSNTFVYPFMALPKNFKQEVPWKVSAELTAELLQDTLKQTVTIVHISLPANTKTVYNANADSVYRRMLQPSDNFIAEQLLLLCSSAKFQVLNTDSVINYSKSALLSDLPDAPQWVDGSGLSRYNLFTPRSIVALLCMILEEKKNDDLVHSLFPAGGSTGSIRKIYKTENGRPFVWAKTGSFSNNYNQCGYLITKKGKRLAFAFMNNNFTRPVAEIRDEIVRIITFIHDEY